MKTFQLMLMYCLTGVQEIVSDTIDWCSLSCGKVKNTMCMYQPQKNAGECKNIEVVTDKAMRKNLLHMHNEYRNKIANGQISSNGVLWPKASNMREMSWDYDLEQLARRWAQQCLKFPPHDACRRTPAFEYNGQNKGWGAQTNGFPSAENSFTGWISEIEKATPGIIDNLDSGSGALHFTQVIWAESYKLGCAAIHADSGGFKTTTLVCNYGPGGNMIGEKVYKRGDPCGSCPSSTSCKTDSKYPQLCAAEGDPRNPEDIPNSSCKLGLFGMQPKNSKIFMSFLSVIKLIINKFT